MRLPINLRTFHLFHGLSLMWTSSTISLHILCTIAVSVGQTGRAERAQGFRQIREPAVSRCTGFIRSRQTSFGIFN